MKKLFEKRLSTNITNSNHHYLLKATHPNLLCRLSPPGYYRVNYDAQNWKLIIVHLKNPKTYQQIAPANRAQLIDDALNLARGGYLSYDIALDVTRYLSHEREYVPWKAAINAINFIDAMLLRSGDYYKFKVSNNICNLLERGR
jgi:aminopeptidase N